jgi:hypothetical protein
MNVEVLTGPQGGGKSTDMRRQAIATPGLYLFALPTIELIEEQSADFFTDEPHLETVKVHKDSGTGSVARRLAEARAAFGSRGVTHGVIFITHETLMSSDLNGFDGWNVRIDEAPAAVQAGRFNIKVVMRDWLTNAVEVIGALGSEWSALKFKTDNPNWKDVERAAGAKPFAEFIKQVSRPDRVFVKTTAWDAKDDIDWFSMWTPLALSHFASVKIAGSSYTDSVGYKAASALLDDKLSFTEREIAPQRTGQPTIEIYYFTQAHEGSTTFWGTSEGRLCIRKICDYLASNLPASGFWSGNEVVQHLMEHRIRAKLIRPLAMGINKHREAEACAFIYSGKATPQDESLKTVFGLTDSDIRKAREDDAVAQFVMRGAIRDLDYSGPYAIYLYSRSQAERLSDHLHEAGFTNVQIAALPGAGILDTKRPKSARPELTPEERKASKEARREKARLRAQRTRDKKKLKS